MSELDKIINQIGTETALHGNTKERVARAFELLNENFKALNTLGGTTDVQTLKNTISAVQNSTNTIKTMVLDEIKIGGRNLLRNTLQPTLLFWQHSVNTQIELGQADCFGGTNAFKMTQRNNEDFYFSTIQYKPYAIKVRGVYTFSFYAKSNRQISFPVGVSDLKKMINVTTEWKKFTITVDVQNPSPYKDIEFAGSHTLSGNSGLELFFSHMKLERGNKDTDYTQAPEDLMSSVVLVSSNFNTSQLFHNGKVAVSQGTSNIVVTIDSESGFSASYQKGGTGNITFQAGSGKTLVQVDGTNILNGAKGSTATITIVGNEILLRISNV